VTIKRRIEIKTHAHQVVRIHRRNTVIRGRCATCGQQVEVTQVEQQVQRSPRKPK
jgi:hypothetical protein